MFRQPQDKIVVQPTFRGIDDIPQPDFGTTFRGSEDVPISKFEEQIGKFYSKIKESSPTELAALNSTAWTGNLFGINAWLSRKGLLLPKPKWYPKNESILSDIPTPKLFGKLEEEKGDVAAFYGALNRYQSELKLSDPQKYAAMLGEIAKITTEFAIVPSFGKGAVKVATKFGFQTSLQAPTYQEEQQPLLTTIQQRGIATGQAMLTGYALGALSKYTVPMANKIAEKFNITGVFAKKLIQTMVETPPIAGGFMYLTHIQGGTKEQILETGLQILGFEALGLAQAGLFGEAAKKAMEFNPELAKEVKPKVLEKTIETILKGEPKTTEVMKESVAKLGMDKLQKGFQDWLKTPEAKIEKDSLGLPEGNKFVDTWLWEAYNRKLYAEGKAVSVEATVENIAKKVEAQIKELKDLRADVANPEVKKLRALQAEQYRSILESEIAAGTPAEQAQLKALAGMKEVANIPEITPPDLTATEWDVLFKKNIEIHKDSFDIVNTRRALVDWRDGKILQPHQFHYLKDVLGIKPATELFFKQQDLINKLNAFDYLKASFQFAKMPFAFDVQFFRQASSFMVRHPIKYIKGGYKALRSYISESFAERVEAATRTSPNYADATEHGLFRLSREAWTEKGAPEQFVLGRPFLRKALKSKLRLVRGTAKWYLASERSMVASCNSFMQGLYDAQIKTWEREGVTGNKLELYKKNYTDTLNTFMKLMQAKTKSGRELQHVANYILFSPSMTFSRLKRPYVMLANAGSRSYAASLVATEIGKFFLLSALVKTAGQLFTDKDGNPSMESSYDPRSTDWGVIKVGNAHYDFGGGDVQFYRTITRLITGEYKNQAGIIKEMPRLKTIERYAKSRETALLGIIMEVATGRDYNGEKIWEMPDWERYAEVHKGKGAKAMAEVGKFFTPTPVDRAMFLGAKELAHSVAPQFLRDIFSAALDSGWGTILCATTSDFLSANVSIYPDSASIQMQKAQLEAAQIEYQKDWDKLGPNQQKLLKRKYPEIKEWEQQSKFERSERDLDITIKPKQLKLSLETKRILAKNSVPYPAIQRTIGSGFYLNDERFELYRTLSIDTIESRVNYLTSSPFWERLSPLQRQIRLTQEIDYSKKIARNKLIQLVNLEMRVK